MYSSKIEVCISCISVQNPCLPKCVLRGEYENALSARYTHIHCCWNSYKLNMPPLFTWSSTHGSKAQPRRSIYFQHIDTPAQSQKNNTSPKLEFGRSYVSSTCGISESGQARMVREGVMISIMYSFTCLTVLALLTGSTADGSVLPKTEKRFTGPLRKEHEVIRRQQLNTSALNTALAFEPYHDLATRTTAEPGVQHPQQRNILFSPLGLASALALLSRVSGSESRSQALEALGLAANSTEQSVEATISALTHLLHNLTLQEGGVGGGVQRAESEAGVRTEARIGATAGVEIGGVDAGNRTDVDDGAEGRTGTEDGVHAGGQLRVWSGLHVDGKRSLDYESFLSGTQHPGTSAFNISFETLMKDLQASDKLELNNYAYFKGSLLLNG